MRRGKKSYALQLREEFSKGSNVVVSSNGYITPKPKQEPVVSKGTGLGSFVAATEKKVVSEMPPATFEETFRGKQDTLIGILRMLVYESEFTEMVKKGQMNQATFDQLKAGALQVYKVWPKEIRAAMLEYQKLRQGSNGDSVKH